MTRRANQIADRILKAIPRGASREDILAALEQMFAAFMALRAHGRSASAPRDTRGRYLSQPKSDRVTSRGNSKTYIIKRLARGGHHVLIGMVRNREISAREGARRAGFGGPPRTHR